MNCGTRSTFLDLGQVANRRNDRSGINAPSFYNPSWLPALDCHPPFIGCVKPLFTASAFNATGKNTCGTKQKESVVTNGIRE